jgi:hypothetical protein
MANFWQTWPMVIPAYASASVVSLALEGLLETLIPHGPLFGEQTTRQSASRPLHGGGRLVRKNKQSLVAGS